MANARRNASAPTLAQHFEPVLDWPTSWVQALTQAQRVQLEALSAWQASVAAVYQELWDEWVSRWAGGVPIDA